MTAEEKAKAGLWLLEQAVLGYLEGHPEGVQVIQIRRELGLDFKGVDRGDHLFWGLHNVLAAAGKVRIETIDGRSCIFPAGRQETAS